MRQEQRFFAIVLFFTRPECGKLFDRKETLASRSHHPCNFLLKLFLDHYRLQKSQENLEVASPVRRILHTWTAQGALQGVSSSTKRPRNTLGNIILGELDTIYKNNLRWIPLRIMPIWGMYSLTLHPLLVPGIWGPARLAKKLGSLRGRHSSRDCRKQVGVVRVARGRRHASTCTMLLLEPLSVV